MSESIQIQRSTVEQILGKEGAKEIESTTDRENTVSEIGKETERGTEGTKDQGSTILSQEGKRNVIIMIEKDGDAVPQKAITTITRRGHQVIAAVVKEKETHEKKLTVVIEEVDHVMKGTTKEIKNEITGTGMKVTRLQEKARIRYMDSKRSAQAKNLIIGFPLKNLLDLCLSLSKVKSCRDRT